MKPTELRDHINAEATKTYDYNTICESCVEVMLEARLTLCDAAGYGISGFQAAMIGQEVSRRMGNG